MNIVKDAQMLWNKKETTKWKTYQGEVKAVIRSKENAVSMCRRRAFVKTGRYNHKAPRSLQYSTLTDKIVKACAH